MPPGRKYTEAREKIDPAKEYGPEEAVKLLKEVSFAKFDETVEVHVRLGIDPRHADQQVRDVVNLPHGLGKPVRVLVFAEGEAARTAEGAGADIVGSDEIAERIEKEGWFDFDVMIAVPEMMGKVGRLGRVLGPRGLMPNPKAGTVVQSDDIPRAIEEFKAGRVEYRNDKTGNLHVPIGKISFSEQQLLENFIALVEDLRRARPAAAKGAYIRKLVLTSTMTPAIKVEPQAAINLSIAA